MPRKLTGHEQETLSKLAQHMGNPLDEFDMAIANRIEELVHEGNYRKMHAAGTAAQEQGSAGARGPILEDF